MILGYSNIKRLIKDKNLLAKYDESNILNSSCRLKIGKIFVPEDGTVIECMNGTEQDSFLSKTRSWLADCFDPRYNRKDGIPQWIQADNYSYTLKPREIILFQTKEIVKLPIDIMAMYSALNTVATKGILLVNASMVEAKYEGPLSGILVNFFKIDGAIKNDKVTDDQTDDGKYSKELRDKAKNVFSKTFLSIGQLGDEIENRINKTVKKDLTMGGLILVFLLAFATLEPLVYKCVWDYPTFDFNNWKHNISNQIEWSEDKKMLKDMQDQIDSLKVIYNENQKRNGTENISGARGI